MGGKLVGRAALPIKPTKRFRLKKLLQVSPKQLEEILAAGIKRCPLRGNLLGRAHFVNQLNEVARPAAREDRARPARTKKRLFP